MIRSAAPGLVAVALLGLAACSSPAQQDTQTPPEPDAAPFADAVAMPEGPPPAWPEGLFGDVRLSEESGDLGGFEVRFYRSGDRRMAEFVLCEGWCNKAYHAQVQRDGGGFVITHTENLIGPDGPEPHQVRYRLTPVEGGLQLEGWSDGNKLSWSNGTPLPPITEPFGLDVANSGAE